MKQNNEVKRILQPKNDVVFHALFTRGKEGITKALLEDILKIRVEKLELDKSTELSNDNIKNKNGRLDLRAVINGNVECDIEIQLLTHDNILERFVYYWSKTYTANLHIGENYNKLRKTISIIIVDNNIEQFRGIDKSHTRWQIREEKYNEIMLTDYFQIDIIEMRKAIKEYETNTSDGLLQWMMFLNNPENKEVIKIMEENNNIKEAKEELNRISQDDSLRRMALRAEIARMDYEQCLYEAKRDGIVKGAKQKELDIARKLLNKKIDINEIADITGLSVDEINDLKK